MKLLVTHSTVHSKISNTNYNTAASKAMYSHHYWNLFNFAIFFPISKAKFIKFSINFTEQQSQTKFEKKKTRRDTNNSINIQGNFLSSTLNSPLQNPQYTLQCRYLFNFVIGHGFFPISKSKFIKFSINFTEQQSQTKKIKKKKHKPRRHWGTSAYRRPKTRNLLRKVRIEEHWAYPANGNSRLRSDLVWLIPQQALFQDLYSLQLWVPFLILKLPRSSRQTASLDRSSASFLQLQPFFFFFGTLSFCVAHSDIRANIFRLWFASRKILNPPCVANKVRIEIRPKKKRFRRKQISSICTVLRTTWKFRYKPGRVKYRLNHPI